MHSTLSLRFWLSLHWMMHVCICGIALFNWLSVALAGKECRRMLPPVSPIKPRSEDKGTMQRWKFLSTLKLWRHAVSSEVARAMDENEHESSAFHPCSHVRWSPLGLAPIPDLPSYTHNSSLFCLGVIIHLHSSHLSASGSFLPYYFTDWVLTPRGVTCVAFHRSKHPTMPHFMKPGLMKHICSEQKQRCLGICDS